jgi:hypothetical protein
VRSVQSKQVDGLWVKDGKVVNRQQRFLPVVIRNHNKKKRWPGWKQMQMKTVNQWWCRRSSSGGSSGGGVLCLLWKCPPPSGQSVLHYTVRRQPPRCLPSLGPHTIQNASTQVPSTHTPGRCRADAWAAGRHENNSSSNCELYLSHSSWALLTNILCRT